MSVKMCAAKHSMCLYRQTNIQRNEYLLCFIALYCIVFSLLMLPASSNDYVTSPPLSLFTVAHSGKKLQAHTHKHTLPEAGRTTLPMCLCVLVESQSVISF